MPDFLHKMLLRELVFPDKMASAIVFSSVFLAIGLGITLLSLVFLIRAYAVRNWPETEGRITKSRVESYVSQGDTDNTLMYKAVVEYKYSVNETNYKGDRVRMGQGASSVEKSAARIVKQYHLERKLPVFYNSSDPSKAFLDRKASKWVYAPLLVGLIMSALAGGLLHATLTGKLKPESEKRGEDRMMSMKGQWSGFSSMT